MKIQDVGSKVIKLSTWKDLFRDSLVDDQDIKFEVEHFSGTPRQVADRARTTLGLKEGDKEVTPEYMRKLYLCEHSPIRIQQYLIRIEGIPYSTAMHFVRHTQGVIPFVSTGRDDRVCISQEETRDRDKMPVYMELMCNPQALINISRKRLCSCSHRRTIAVWKAVKGLITLLNEPLGMAMVPDCIYRGWCYEHKTCKFHLSNKFRNQLAEYRSNINQIKPKDIPHLHHNDIIQIELSGDYNSSGIALNNITATFIDMPDNRHIIVDYNKNLHIIPCNIIKEIKKVGC